MNRRIRLSMVLTLSMMLMMVSLPAMAQVRQPARRGAIGTGGAGLYGLKSKSRKQVFEREQDIDIRSAGGSSKSRKRVLSNSRTRVGSRRIIGTTYGGNGQSTLRKRTNR